MRSMEAGRNVNGCSAGCRPPLQGSLITVFAPIRGAGISEIDQSAFAGLNGSTHVENSDAIPADRHQSPLSERNFPDIFGPVTCPPVTWTFTRRPSGTGPITSLSPSFAV